MLSGSVGGRASKSRKRETSIKNWNWERYGRNSPILDKRNGTDLITYGRLIRGDNKLTDSATLLV